MVSHGISKDERSRSMVSRQIWRQWSYFAETLHIPVLFDSRKGNITVETRLEKPASFFTQGMRRPQPNLKIYLFLGNGPFGPQE